MSKNLQSLIVSFTSAILLVFLSYRTQAQTLQQAYKAIAPDKAPSDQFGLAVAISGDYALIGARQESEDAAGNNTKTNAGSVYVFKRTAGNWAFMQKLVSSDRAANDYFGASVSISGDYALIGAYPKSGGGAAYVFKLNSGTWVQQQKLLSSDLADNDQFGYNVAINGGYALVGAIWESENQSGKNTRTRAGSAYVFKLSGSTWTQQQKLIASDRTADDYFGCSVAINGDYAIIGARQQDDDAKGKNSMNNAGAAYVFKLSGSTWSEQQKLVPSNRAQNDNFGYSVSINGNYALIGARQESEDASESNTLSNAGSAYLFRISGTTWSQYQKLVASDRAANNYFGGSVSLRGNYAVVGSLYSAYAFRYKSGNWTSLQQLKSADYDSTDQFGCSVDVDGTDFLVGAYLEDSDGVSNSGSAYIFSAMPPQASNVKINGTLLANEVLTGTYTFTGNGGSESGTAYQWYRSNDASGTGKIAISGANTVSFTPTTADLGKYISFAVTPANDVPLVGSTVESNLYGTIKTPPTLSGFADITKNYGDAAFTLNAPASTSDGAFTYSSSDENVATISGNTITLIGGGTITITATQAATAIYSEASISLTLTVIWPTPDADGIVYVKKGAAGTGTSWSNAIGELAYVLRAAKTNTAIKQIWVAKGTYYPMYSPQDGANFGTEQGRNNAFLLIKDVKIYGGFDPDNGITDLTHARQLPSPSGGDGGGSILSGDFNDNDVVSGGGSTLTIANNTDNAYHVVVSAGNVGTALLDGFAIIGGNANGSGSFNVNSKATSRNVGGGIAIIASSPTFSNVVIGKNTAESGGGVVNLSVAKPTFTNAIIYKNIATYASLGGGGVYNAGASIPVFYHTVIAQNKAPYGGAIYNYDGTQYAVAVFLNSVVYGNSSGIGGYSSTGLGPLYSQTYSLIQGSTSTTNGNINGNTDPRFVDMANDDYRLATGSTLIDNGSNLYAASNTDLAGNARIRNNTVDIGAYENQSGNTIPYIKSGANGIVYVKKGATGTGSSWSDALGELADALLAAKLLNDVTSGTVKQIWVAGGKYYPMYSPQDGANFGVSKTIDNTFLLVKDVKVYGRFAGTETTLAQRDLTANTSTLSGDLGTANFQGDNACHVVLSVGDVGTAELNGFTITRGYAAFNGTITVASKTIDRTCGGGMYNITSSPTITNVTINGNEAYSGGGMYNATSSKPVLTDVVISGNESSGFKVSSYGGGMYNANSSPMLTNVVIRGNKCSSAGSSTSSYGAGMYNISSSPVLTNVVISGNQSVATGVTNSLSWGGGVYNDTGASLVLTNVAITGNTAGFGSAISHYSSASPTLTNVTIAGNKTTESAGGPAAITTIGTFKIRNSIILGNSADNSGTFTITNSLVQGKTSTANGNISATGVTADQVFVNPLSAGLSTGGDYSLKEGSPVINKGNNTLFTDLNADTKDLAGNARVNNYGTGGVIDMGAYESAYVMALNPVYTYNETISKTYGSANFNLDVASTSNGDIIYSSSDETVATIVGNTVTVKGIGTATITGIQSETDTYNAGTITITLTVGKANPTFANFANINKTYGNTDFSLGATSTSDGTITYTSSDETVAAISGSTVTIAGAGTATLTATQAATDNYNEGSISVTLTVGKANAVLSAFANITKTYGDGDFDLTAPTSNSAGTFTYSSSNENVATILGNTLTIVGAGTATITATQAETANYNAGSVSLTLKVVKGNPVLSDFANISKAYGDDDFTLTAPASTSDGAITYTSNKAVVATIDGNIVTIKSVGTATITATQAATDNYNAGSITLTLTVVKGTPTLSGFADINKTYKDAAFELTAPTSNSSGGFIYTSSDNSVASIVSGRVSLYKAGTVTIAAKQLATAYYNEASISLTLTVNKANPTLSSFANISKTYGNASFNLANPTSTSSGTFTYSSSDENVAVIDGKKVTIVGAGTATITATQAETDNYNAGSIALTLTVGKANPTLSGFANISKTYGNGSFNLTAPTSTSNGTFTYSSNDENVAVIDGKNVTIIGTGTATITATQAETANYNGGTIGLTLTVGKANQAITFYPLDAKTISSPDFVLTATASSGLSLSYTSSNTAIAEVYQDGSVWKVRIKGEGTTNITASQFGNGNYFSADNVVQQLLVIGAPLPVNLINYTAKIDGNYVKLQWQTSSERNNKEFIIYRSGDDGYFVKLGEMSSSSRSNYSYIDYSPLNGNNYYKLVQIDNDGTENELDVRTVNFRFSNSDIRLYPNPVQTYLYVTVQKLGIVYVYDILGKLVLKQKVQTGVNQLDIHELHTGQYHLIVDDQSIKFIKQ